MNKDAVILRKQEVPEETTKLRLVGYDGKNPLSYYNFCEISSERGHWWGLESPFAISWTLIR